MHSPVNGPPEVIHQGFFSPIIWFKKWGSNEMGLNNLFPPEIPGVAKPQHIRAPCQEKELFTIEDLHKLFLLYFCKIGEAHLVPSLLAFQRFMKRALSCDILLVCLNYIYSSFVIYF